MTPTTGDHTASEVARLWRARGRSRFVRVSLLVFAALIAAGWLYLGADLTVVFSPEGAEDIAHFFEHTAKPRPLEGRPWAWDPVAAWVGQEMDAHGWHAVGVTLAVSVLSIVLAAVLAMALCLPAARTFATPEPFVPDGAPPTRGARRLWRLTVGATRTLLIGMRSMPEYILAFLLVTVVGVSAWPAVLALAIHNAGILGRLNAEVIENLPTRTLQSLRAAGAGRRQLALFGVLPAALPRFLMYFFYRWETCVREATVLSMIGMAGIGYWLWEADSHDNEPLVFLYVLLSSALVLIGDFVSAIARRMVRRAS